MPSYYPRSPPLGSSLPNDYAILSYFASSQDDSPLESDNDTTIDGSGGPESPTSSRFIVHRVPPHDVGFQALTGHGEVAPMSSARGRRLSMPHRTHGATRRMSGGQAANLPARPTEREPLLGADNRSLGNSGNERDGHESETWQMWLQEFKIISKYTAPVFGTHLLEYSLSMASVISIGHLSTNHLAAVTLGSMTSAVTGLSIILGFVSALDSLLPHAWSSNPNLVGLWSQRMLVLLAMLLVPILTVWFNAEPILLMLKQEPEIAHLAGTYLRWLSTGLPAYAFNSVARRYLQSIGLMHVPTYIVILVAPINMLLNWLLVWGPEPFKLGYKGAPISTAISFNLISVLTVAYGILYSPPEAWHPLSSKSFKKLGLLMRLGLGGVGQVASEWWSWELLGLAASFIGPVSLASQSVLLVTASTAYQAPFALSMAASVRIGNHLGAAQALRAKVATSVAIHMALIMALFLSTFFMIFRDNWAYIFNDDIKVVKLVARIMPLVALFQIFDGLCAVTGGVLRSRGSQSLGALLNFICYYIIGIPLGLILAFVYDFALYGLWIGVSVALLVGSPISVTIVLLTDWNREIERVQARLAEDQDAAKISVDAA